VLQANLAHGLPPYDFLNLICTHLVSLLGWGIGLS
jgi:hypothetical protein